MAKKKQENYYFDTLQEEAVMKFLITDSQTEKDRLFREYLYEPITKMAESQIKRYGLMRGDSSIEDQILDATCFVTERLYKFDPLKNKKAYSYYGTISVNFFKTQLIKWKKLKNRDICFEDAYNDLDEDERIFGSYDLDVDDTPKIEAYEFIPFLIKGLEKELEENNKLKDKDIKVGRTIIQLLNNWEDFIDGQDGSNILNRNKVLYYIRENTLLESKDLRSSMKKFKSLYFLLKKDIMGD